MENNKCSKPPTSYCSPQKKTYIWGIPISDTLKMQISKSGSTPNHPSQIAKNILKQPFCELRSPIVRHTHSNYRDISNHAIIYIYIINIHTQRKKYYDIQMVNLRQSNFSPKPGTPWTEASPRCSVNPGRQRSPEIHEANSRGVLRM